MPNSLRSVGNTSADTRRLRHRRRGPTGERRADEQRGSERGSCEELVGALAAHRTRLEAFVRSQVSDRHMAEDVVADVFVAAWRRRDELPRETARAVGWLYATARNVIRNHVRGEMRRRKLVEKATRHTATSPYTATDFVPGVDRLAAAAAWNELPATERQLLVLVGTGASHSEIAEVLGISLGGVAMRVMRARVRLRRALEN